MASRLNSFDVCKNINDLSNVATVSDDDLRFMHFTCLGSLNSAAFKSMGARIQLLGTGAGQQDLQDAHNVIKFLSIHNLKDFPSLTSLTDDQVRNLDDADWTNAPKPAHVHWAERHACNVLKGKVNTQAFKDKCTDILSIVPRSTGLPAFAITLIAVLVLAVVGASLAYIFMRKRAAVDEEMKMSSFDEKKEQLQYSEAPEGAAVGSGDAKRNPYEVTERASVAADRSPSSEEE